MALIAMSLPVMGLLFFLSIVLFFFLLGRLTWGSGADLLDWDPAGRNERRRVAEDEDIDQLLEVANERRERQGRTLLTHDNVIETLGEEHKGD
jgi:hypothetical protein